MKILSILILIIIISSFFTYGILNLEKRIDSQEKEISILKKNVSTLNNKLLSINETIYKISKEFNETIISQEDLIEHQKKEISNLSNSLNEFENEIQDKIKWIKSNANINNVTEYSTTKNLMYKCTSSGEINLGCISFLIFEKEKMKYIRDIKEGTNDTLYNLSEIYEHGGGDCEDLSLLFASSIRYAMNKYNLTKFNGWVDGDSKYIVYSTRDEYYYMKNAEKISFSANYIYITCGEIYNKSEGHCIVSLCKNKIKDSYDLLNCTNVEPQEYGKIININGPIELYISSNDLCLNKTNIKFNNQEMKCFSDFENEIKYLLNTK